MLIPHFLSLIGSNFIWSILSKIIELVGVLNHRHLSLNQVMKLSSLDEHRPCEYKDSMKGLSELLLGELRIGLQAGTIVMPPLAGHLMQLIKIHLLFLHALQ